MSTNFRNGFAAAALLAAAGLVISADANAQTATDLACKGCVGARDIGKNAVTGKAIRNNTVSAKKIRNNAVQARHLANEAKPAGVASAVSPGPVALTGSYETAHSVEIAAPGPGAIVATASYTVHFFGAAVYACDIAASDTASLNTSFGQGNAYTSASMTRVIPVTAAGAVTLNLLCTESGGDVELEHINLTALFVPASY